MSDVKASARMLRTVQEDSFIRMRHDEYYRDLGISLREYPETQPDLAESRFLIFGEFLNSDDAVIDKVAGIGAKGISATLAAADQYGNWSSGAALDCAIRRLPESKQLKDQGATFVNTYDQKDKAMISYGARVLATADGSTFLATSRKRAAADVELSGHKISIIKRSSFLINERYMDRRERMLALKLKSILGADESHPLEPADDFIDIFGALAVEPVLDNHAARIDNKAVKPASMTYFALKRS